MRDNTKERILSATNLGLDVFNYYLPYSLPMRKNFKSPFYDDSKASCNVFQGKDGVWRFKDFGEGGDYSGDCFWFVGKLKGFNLQNDFPKILDTIINDLHLSLPKTLNTNPSISRQMTRQNISLSKEHLTSQDTLSPTSEFSYIKKEYTEKELAFWEFYGITKATLKQYKVYSLKSFSSRRNSDGQPYTINSTESSPLFLYDLDTTVKVYRPFDNLRFLNAGDRTETKVFGFEQLPMKGDIVIITGGEKDVMSFSVRGFAAICFNSETSQIDTHILEMLQRRFKHILLCYDMDDCGIKASQAQVKLLSQYKVLRLALPLSGIKTEKDISDYFAQGHTRDDMQAIITKMLEKTLYQQTMALLSSCEIDMNNPPESSKALVMLEQTILGSFDNLFCITGGEGTGKSHYVSALVSGAIRQHPLAPADTLGMSVTPNPEGKAVLHYDTEQSDSQLYKNVKRSLKRAQLSTIPPYYHALCLTALSRTERINLIKESMDMYYHRHDGIHLVVIDGIADLITSANNEIESIALVDELYRLASIYNTCIVCVLHLTPGGLKLRGHLGSELQRKAAGIISIEKDKANASLSVVKAIKVRDGDPLDVPMITYGWDKTADMHVYRYSKMKESSERKYNELKSLAEETLSSGEMPYNEFVRAISDKLLTQYDLKDKRTVLARIEFMLRNEIIYKSDDMVTLNA